MDQLDWNQLRAFLLTAETGSLSAAARRLGLTQPTLGRQVAAIEQQLGVSLFERIGRTVQPTATGRALLEHARAMGMAAQELGLAASGHAQAIDGVVSVSATDMMSAYMLPPLLLELRRQAPALRIDVVTTSALSDLRRREADIALRHVRPSEPELIGRLLREGRANFYASQDWVRRYGHPRSSADARGLSFVGSDQDGSYLSFLKAHGLSLDDSNFSCFSASTATVWALVRHGLGIAPMVDEVARTCPDVVRVLDDLPPIRFPIWLVTHRELRTSRRIRLVWDAIVAALAVPGAEAEAVD